MTTNAPSDDKPASLRFSAGLGPLPDRWYCVSRDGLATLCASEQNAREMAAECAKDYPRQAPYRAAILGDVAAERERIIRALGSLLQCPCCGETMDCSDDCTFAVDCPAEAANLDVLRDAVRA